MLGIRIFALLAGFVLLGFAGSVWEIYLRPVPAGLVRGIDLPYAIAPIAFSFGFSAGAFLMFLIALDPPRKVRRR